VLAKLKLVLAKFKLALAKFKLALAKFKLALAKFKLALAKFKLALAKFKLALAKFKLALAKFKLAFEKFKLATNALLYFLAAHQTIDLNKKRPYKAYKIIQAHTMKFVILSAAKDLFLMSTTTHKLLTLIRL